TSRRRRDAADACARDVGPNSGRSEATRPGRPPRRTRSAVYRGPGPATGPDVASGRHRRRAAGGPNEDDGDLPEAVAIRWHVRPTSALPLDMALDEKDLFSDKPQNRM